MKIKQLLTILCVCFSINLHSQEGTIIYTDFEPDSVIILSYTSYPFDVNYDSIPDFEFFIKYTSGGNYNCFQKLSEALYNFKVETITSNDTIPLSDYIWKYSNVIMYDYNKDYNLGIRQPIDNDNYCYGWIRLNLYYDQAIKKTKVTFYDMAYCTIPNYPLRIGQKVIDDLATDEITESKDYVLFPSPANDKITLKFNNDNIGKEVLIYGIDGRLLKTLNSDFDNIDVSDLASGIYVMKIHLDNGNAFTEKFVKE